VSAAADQHAKRDKHTATKVRKVRTPLQKTAPLFDAWRRRVSELPPEVADAEAVALTAHLRARIERLKPRSGGDGS
jgi:hypothetical protein